MRSDSKVDRAASPLRRRQRRTASRGLPLLLAVTFLAFVNYAALLSVVPLWASTGGAASAAVGATTGVMMAATVATQFAMPWVFRVLRLREMMIVGAVLLSVPTPLYLLSAGIAPTMAITAVRGIGFGFVVMAGATLAADLAPEGRLARSVSLYGVAAALPNLAALAGGVWIAHTWGFQAVFWASGAVTLAGAGLAFLLPGQHRGHFSLTTPTSMGAIAAPVVLFLMTAGSFGAATTFLPVVVPNADVASLALLAASIALVLARLAAGAIGDRYGAGKVLLTAVLVSGGGLALIAVSLTTDTGLLLLGATLLGAGFGAAQNDSFVLTVQRLGEGRTGTASTIWNVAYDGGLGLGAIALGWVAGHTGYTGAFLATAAVVAACVLILARLLIRRRTGYPRAGDPRP